MDTVEGNLMKIAELLIYGEADLNARYGIGGETFLSTTLWFRSWDFAIKLIENGAGVTYRAILTQALKQGAYAGAEGTVKAVLRFATHQSNPPYTPLAWAAGRNDADVVQQLIAQELIQPRRTSHPADVCRILFRSS
jgi:hypothetical protein